MSLKDNILKIASKMVEYEYHSTQINVDQRIPLIRLQKRIKKNNVYYENDVGLEDECHVTALYGLEKENDYFRLRKKLENFGSFSIKLGPVSSFRYESNPYDVLFFEIDSPRLHDLHWYIRENFSNVYSYPEYKPHMTIGYIKKGTHKELEGKHPFMGMEVYVNKICWSHKDGYYLDLPLGV